MAELFQTTPDNVGLHLKNIYAECELAESATAEDFSVVQNEGGRTVRRTLRHHSLDAIIAVGYRVSSKRATQFRIWATQILNEYIRKGFVLDDERLKQGKQVFGEDYFLELLERVRSIRASERRIYQQITDIFAECSVDYDPKSDITQTQAEMETFILDQVFLSLPEPPYTPQDKADVAQLVYQHICQQSTRDSLAR